ncbi:MAG: hypothetical protein Fur007_07110 [Rhodoferax sp.]
MAIEKLRNAYKLIAASATVNSPTKVAKNSVALVLSRMVKTVVHCTEGGMIRWTKHAKRKAQPAQQP